MQATVMIALAALVSVVVVITLVKLGKTQLATAILMLAIAYEVVGMTLWVYQMTQLFSGAPFAVATRFIHLGTSAGNHAMVAGGSTTALLAAAITTYLVCAAIVVTTAVKVLLDYRHQRSFTTAANRTLTHLGRAMVFGGITTVLVQFTCEAIWSALWEPNLANQVTQSATTLPNGAAWIVPGTIIMLLPTLMSKAISMKDEVDYLV
ncbi:MAG: hypothetical protein Q4P06_06550 [Actinomycetaceae bacterium]|nr:hypothetical protein [Actinomycetaceae bacterium]